MHDSFLTYANKRYLWVALVLLLGSIVAYVWHDPSPHPNGGTWLGYTLGTIGALLIYWLTMFGLRKRAYASNVGSVGGWLSAHVYLGTALLLVALLHSGFQFGWNVHTLAFTLMTLVIFSGFFGVFAYLRYPALMTSNRENASRQTMLEEIASLDQQSLQLADGIDARLHAIVARSIDNTRFGGSVLEMLRTNDASEQALRQVRAALDKREKEGQAGEPKTQEMPTMYAMVDFLAAKATDTQAEAMRKLVDALSRKKALASRVGRDIQLQSLMELWLYVHVPLTFALLAALTAHIIIVFFYW